LFQKSFYQQEVIYKKEKYENCCPEYIEQAKKILFEKEENFKKLEDLAIEPDYNEIILRLGENKYLIFNNYLDNIKKSVSQENKDTLYSVEKNKKSNDRLTLIADTIKNLSLLYAETSYPSQSHANGKAFDTNYLDNLQIQNILVDTMRFYGISCHRKIYNSQMDDFHYYFEEYPENTVINLGDFIVEILNYQVQNDVLELGKNATKDTVALNEWMGSNIENRKIVIKTNNRELKFFMEYSLNDFIFEQYNYCKVKNYEEWAKTRDKWEGFTDYEKLYKLSDYEFQFPNFDGKSYKRRKRELSLRDTLVNLSGETDNIATLVYNGKPAIYSVDNVYIKITVLNGNQKNVKYLKIVRFYGC
jgi:hypothetical protein